MWRLTGEMLPLTLSNCLHFVSLGLCWEFDLGLRVRILDRKSIFIGETLICSTTIAILFRTHRFSPKFWHFPNAANLTVAINSFSFLLISCSSISICFLLSTTLKKQCIIKKSRNPKKSNFAALKNQENLKKTNSAELKNQEKLSSPGFGFPPAWFSAGSWRLAIRRPTVLRLSGRFYIVICQLIMSRS